MQYEKRKIILPKFDTLDELIDYVSDDVAVHYYQSGDYDKFTDNKSARPTLSHPLTLDEFLASVRLHFPNGFRIGDKYVSKWGTKIDE